jgi:3-dehydrosphinganine reductase
MAFAGQHAIVTGGSSGIGKALAHLLVLEGAHVSIVARNQSRLEQALAELSEVRQDADQRIVARSTDLADWEQTQETISELIAGGYPPDILANVAGYCHPGYFEELPVQVLHRSMAVDYFGTVHPTKVVVPAMIERRRGHIVNFSSVAGFQAIFGFSAYSPAKYAVSGFSEVLRQEMKRYGITVSLVYPPTTLTPGLERENEIKPVECAMVEGQAVARTPHEVAAEVLRGIRRGRRYILPGMDTKFYFFAAHLPKWLTAPLEWFLIDRVIERASRTRKAVPDETPAAE